jgi:excisionase family DNA binding protein
MQEHYTAQEAATQLNVCVTTIYRMVKRGKLTGTKEKGRLFIPFIEIQQFIDKEKALTPKSSVESTIDFQVRDLSPSSDQVKVSYSLRFLKWLLRMNRLMNRTIEAMIVFLESDGKAP